VRNRRGVWVRQQRIRGAPSEDEKAAIVAACDRLIADTLKPRLLPAIRPTTFNYPVDLYGKWSGGRYRFIQRYRSGFPDNRGWEFEAPFARLDYLAPDCFDVMWHRHSGQWWRLHHSVSLPEALHHIEHDGLLHPL
jgi:hypothetical protein